MTGSLAGSSDPTTRDQQRLAHERLQLWTVDVHLCRPAGDLHRKFGFDFSESSPALVPLCANIPPATRSIETLHFSAGNCSHAPTPCTFSWKERACHLYIALLVNRYAASSAALCSGIDDRTIQLHSRRLRGKAMIGNDVRMSHDQLWNLRSANQQEALRITRS